MWNGYQPYRGGIRFFPHIVPILFPLIFPFGIGLAFALFHALFHVLGFLILAAIVFFIVRAVMLKSPGAAWNSMWSTGNQWRQRFESQQPPYYQPQQPYYQPTPQPGQESPSQTYTHGYQQAQPNVPYYQPSAHSDSFEQPGTHYPEQMPPMQQ